MSKKSNCRTRDRISHLPESLLHHIHSFLGIKDGARTSVLSKRWKGIWTTVPVLEFKLEQSVPPSKTGQFIDFVDGTLHRHSSNVDKFFIQGRDCQLSKSRLRSWISTVVIANVKELGLYFHQNDSMFVRNPLSLDIFTCQSLTSLELGTHPNVRLPENISLPNLKRLILFEYEINDECWNEQLLSNSTVLEELILRRCTFRRRNFSISIPTLKILEIMTVFYDEDGLQDCVLKIDAPKLVTLSYWGSIAKEFVLSSFPALVEATVCFKENDGAEALLHALAHVKRLNVNDKALQVVCSASNLLTFHNVKMLNISDVVTTDQGLISLLKAVPNLEALVFEEHMTDKAIGYSDEGDKNDGDEHSSEEADSWALDIVTARCLFQHLQSVCFKEFVGNPREMKWVRLILRDAKALQIMTIHNYGSWYFYANARSEKEVMVEIPCFPRASPDCVFKFFSANNHDNDDSEGSGQDADSAKGENNHGNDEEIDLSGSGEDADSVEGEKEHGNDEEIEFSDDSEDESWH